MSDRMMMLACYLLLLAMPSLTYGQSITLSSIPSQGIISEAEQMVRVCAAITPGVETTNDVIVAVVTLATSDGTARAGMDYTAQSTQLTLDTSVNSERCITISVATDSLLEGRENFFVSGTVMNFTINGTSLPLPSVVNSPVMIDVLDNSVVTLRFEEADYMFNEDELNPQVCVVVDMGTIVRTLPPVVASISAIPGTATEGDDYEPIDIQVELDNTTPRSCVTIPLIRDGILEEDEEFTLGLTSSISDTQIDDILNETDITIMDDDQVTVGFSMSTYNITEGQGMVDTVVCVEVLDGMFSDSFELIINVQATPGSADPNSDYILPMENMLTFSRLNNISCLSINIIDDPVVENTENFSLMIADDMFENYNTSIGEATVFIVDNDQIIPTTTMIPETTTPPMSMTISVADATTSPPTAALTTTAAASLPTTTEAISPPTTTEVTILPTAIEATIQPTAIGDATVQPTTIDATIQPTTIDATIQPTTIEATIQPTTILPMATSTAVTLTPTPTPTTIPTVPPVVECPRLFRPMYSYIKVFSQTVGSTATYGCITGFRLRGTSERVCLANGMWSGSVPSCEAITCPPLFRPWNSSIFFTRGNRVTSSAWYYCNRGYYLCGNRRRSCRPDGRWSGSVPLCLKRSRRCYLSTRYG